MLSTFSGCKVQIPSGRPAAQSKARGGGWEEDNKATGEGHEAVEIVSGIAEWWLKRHEKRRCEKGRHRGGGEGMRGLREKGRTVVHLGMLAGEEKPSCPLPAAGPQE